MFSGYTTATSSLTFNIIQSQVLPCGFHWHCCWMGKGWADAFQPSAPHVHKRHCGGEGDKVSENDNLQQLKKTDSSPVPAAASACAAVIPAVCCDPPRFASWLLGGLCADEATWPLRWVQHLGDSGGKWASSQEGMAVETVLCDHVAASACHILPAGF